MKNVLFTLCILVSFGAFAQQSTDNGPRVVFGELQHEGPYDRSEILLQDRLTVTSGDGEAYEISSYHLTISPAKGKPIRFEEQGNKLSPKMQGALNQIVAGDEVRIESVFVQVNDDASNLIELKPIALKIKEFESDGPYGSKYGASNTYKLDSVAQATFGTIQPHSGAYTKEDLVQQQSITVYSSEGVNYTVKSFKVIIAFKDAPAIMATSNGDQLTSQMTKMLSNVSSGDCILIEGIRAQADVDGKTINATLSPIVLTVP